MPSTATDPGAVIKERLRELGLSQARFSKLVGKSPGWAAARFIPNVENMVRYFAYKEPQTLKRILRALQWSPNEFVEATGIDISGPDFLPGDLTIPVTSVIIPIVEAGAGLPSWTDAAEWIALDLPGLKRFSRQDLFAIRVRGDSMEPTLREGDIVVFARDEEPRHGVVVAVQVPDDGLLVKRLARSNNTYLLVSDNHKYAPRPLQNGERIYGVFKALVRDEV